MPKKEGFQNEEKKKVGGRESGNLNPQCSVDTEKALEHKIQNWVIKIITVTFQQKIQYWFYSQNTWLEEVKNVTTLSDFRGLSALRCLMGSLITVAE